MDNFDLKKYLVEGKLREGIFDRFKNTSKPQNPKSDSPFFPNREISDNRLKIEKFIDKEWSRYTGAIEYNEIDDIVNGIEKEWVDNISKYSNIDAFLKDFKEDKRLKKYLAEGKLNEDLFGKYATRKAPRDTTDKNNPDYALYMGNDDPEYRRFYMALKRLIEKSSKNLDQNFEILDWIESLLNNIRPGK